MTDRSLSPCRNKPFRRALQMLALAVFLPLALHPATAEEKSPRSTSEPPPNRMVKTALSVGEYYEPTEMTILPNLDVLIVQRRGEIVLFDQESQENYVLGVLDVYYTTEVENVNAEEGVLGIAADPDFSENGFIYIFYSPRDKSVNRLSRFTFRDDRLDMDSEKIVLEFFSQRDICCHTGGSVAFGPDRLLYLSTGDNSTPFDDPSAKYVNAGFAPLNEQPGKEQYDARRTSANTNDLRGKILRIRVLPDGSYEIPDGNLFPDTDKTRPEIFTMGHRNPYRISVDPKTGTLYWGDVGPDAKEDKLSTRGPRGYDEMNRATEAGNYGWPMFIADNYPYRNYDYSTGETGRLFDPLNPINDSVNNTGLQELPPAQASFIWYPYAESPEFEFVGSGGRNAMAGPVYHKDLYPERTRLADFYDGKVIMYDWIRGWMIAVSFTPEGDLATVDRFMDHSHFASPIDMELGPDGRVYILEYGSGWFSKNEDSGLSRIDYLAGNLPPVVGPLQLSRTSGLPGLRLVAEAEVVDPDGDGMRYFWSAGEQSVETDGPLLRTTLNAVGWHEVSLTVKDGYGSTTQSETLSVYVGNQRPTVDLKVSGNQSLYFPGETIRYQTRARDRGERVDTSRIRVTTDVREASSLGESAVGHQVVSRAELGEAAMLGSDCRACHKLDTKSIGPAYVDVARRYAGAEDVIEYLAGKVINGSSGVWGELAMPAHPSMETSDARNIAAWILSTVDSDAERGESLPARGKITPSEIVGENDGALFVLKAEYEDSPGEGRQAFQVEASLSLSSNRLGASQLSPVFGMEQSSADDLQKTLSYTQPSALIQLPAVDLTGVGSLAVMHDSAPASAFTIEARASSKDGPLVGKASFPANASDAKLRLRRAAAHSFQALYLSISFDSDQPSGARLESVAYQRR